MNSDAFVCHPSVRIRGTENNYNPTSCLEMECVHRMGPHMHCPFCTKAEAFQDPVILKAHYRVKHVDKGVDFAGLKILRCCDSCEIVGVIKGEKRFKGAHWHCYRCKNGFNRRDEAIKHYNTHFRNPRTTFQIQIAQEVNQNYTTSYSPLSHQNVSRITTLTQDEINTSQTVQQAVLSITNAEAALDTSTPTTYTTTTTSIAANETVRSTETILIIDDKLGQENLMFLGENVEPGEYCTYDDFYKEKNDLKKKLTQLQVRNHRLESENRTYKQQVEQLKLQLSLNEDALLNQRKRESDLVEQLSAASLPDKVQHLLDALRQDHQQLLTNHLVCVRDAVLSQFSDSNFSSQSSKMDYCHVDDGELSEGKRAIAETIEEGGGDKFSPEEEEEEEEEHGEEEVTILVHENLEIVADNSGDETNTLYVVDECQESPAKKFCPS